MDADVFITVAFGLEVAVFAAVGGFFIAREVRRASAQAAAERPGEVGLVDSAPARSWGPGANVLLASGSVTAALMAAAFATAVAVHPPWLGWLGFAIAALVALALGVLVALLIPRVRVSPATPAAASDRKGRLLVVADAHCSQPALGEAIREHRRRRRARGRSGSAFAPSLPGE
jgi:hypothetical protein